MNGSNNELVGAVKICGTAAMLLVSWAGAAHAAQLTAVCKDPAGTMYRYDAGAQKPSVDVDGYKNAVWTFLWDSATPNSGTLVTQNSEAAGGGVSQDKVAALASANGDFITFMASYPHSVWVYTLFPANAVMMASRHGLGFGKELGIGGTFHAKCSMG